MSNSPKIRNQVYGIQVKRRKTGLSFVPPMECKQVSDLSYFPRTKDWQYEIKFDGYRCIVVKEGSEVRLYSRRGKQFMQFPSLVETLAQQPGSFILDGEIVALDENGRPSFNNLQNVRSGVAVHLYAFDLIHLNGEDLTAKPLSVRQRLLAKTLKTKPTIHLVTPLVGDLDVIAEKIQEFGFEGLVAKQKSSIYQPGLAPGTWLKKKIQQTEEFIIGGFIPGKYGLNEVVVGKYRGRDLIYVASIDDGFVPATRKKVFTSVNDPIDVCPFSNLPEKKGQHRMDKEKMKKVVWVEPKVVVEIAMNEWTPDGHLRHARFLRLRPELTIKDVSQYPR